MAGAGCKLQSDFKLHVTLGRLKEPGIELAEVKEALGNMPKPSFNLMLSDVDFRVFRGELLYEMKLKREK